MRNWLFPLFSKIIYEFINKLKILRMDKKIYEYYLYYTPIIFAITHSITRISGNKLRIPSLDIFFLESSHEFLILTMFFLFVEKLEIDKNNRNRFFKKRCVKQ